MQIFKVHMSIPMNLVKMKMTEISANKNVAFCSTNRDEPIDTGVLLFDVHLCTDCVDKFLLQCSNGVLCFRVILLDKYDLWGREDLRGGGSMVAEIGNLFLYCSYDKVGYFRLLEDELAHKNDLTWTFG
mmetsp:Transcript_9840/g.14407  ORF Transcript_9840/g.14407 Transcript_9840/m.14407 type:complete len:129 (+) Transcript_9840:170-556(+)